MPCLRVCLRVRHDETEPGLEPLTLKDGPVDIDANLNMGIMVFEAMASSARHGENEMCISMLRPTMWGAGTYGAGAVYEEQRRQADGG